MEISWSLLRASDDFAHGWVILKNVMGQCACPIPQLPRMSLPVASVLGNMILAGGNFLIVDDKHPSWSLWWRFPDRYKELLVTRSMVADASDNASLRIYLQEVCRKLRLVI